MLVFVTAGIIPMVGILALIADVGIAYADRRQLQNAVDAATLAAVTQLPDDPVAAHGLAIQYLELNGVDTVDPKVTISFPDDGNPATFGVEVIRERDTIFAGLFGLDTLRPNALAVARTGVPDGVGGVMPWGVEVPPGGFETGNLYCLKLGAGNDETCGGAEHGNFHALDIDDVGNASANIYKSNIINGSSTNIYIGDIKNVVPGNMAGPTYKGTGCKKNNPVQGLIWQNTQTYEDVVDESTSPFVVDWTSPRMVIVPVVDFDGENHTAEVVGFGVFYILGCNANASVEGYFVFPTILSAGGSTAATGSNSFGARTISLIE